MTFAAALLPLLTVVVVLALLYRPLGDYMARTFTSTKDLRVERGFYRVLGVDPASHQPWRSYLTGVLCFSVVGVLLVYVLQRTQAVLPYSLGLPAVPEGLAFNTAVSFVANTNWQSYLPEATMGYAVQMTGLAVQNFVSAAVGLAVAIAFVRGLAARRRATLGNFWVDLTRALLRILLPGTVIAANQTVPHRRVARSGEGPHPAAPARTGRSRRELRRRARGPRRQIGGQDHRRLLHPPHAHRVVPARNVDAEPRAACSAGEPADRGLGAGARP
ncbi:uncharacterized membrane protein HdeD (DUF308 family) [Arthrobacter sp. PL16]|nr:uncharacterized membrane protein HdeD (DUF308 family) [Arthrobacter sp. PL16]